MTLAWNIEVKMTTLMWLVFLLGGISLKPDSCTACIFGSSADCVFRCHCASSEVCDVTTGQCTGQCEGGSPQPIDDVTRFDWRGPACQIGNVALGKSAEQSGMWGGLVADNAVDGILGYGGNDNCAHPDAGSGSPAWWRVDLGSIHAIHNVTVFNTHDGGGAVRMEEFMIGVGNTTDVTEHMLCASLGSPAVAAGGDVTLACNSPLYGRYASFRRTGGNQPHLVTICEFVVMGYKQTNAACDNCASNFCDDILGCMDCSPSFSKEPICDEGCAAGFYGDGCSSTCGSCNGSVPCRYTGGTCPDGCQQWYTGDKCDLYIDERVLNPLSNPSMTNASSSTLVDVEWKSEEGIPDSLVFYYGYVVQYGLSGSDDKATSNDVPHQANQSHHSITIRGLQPATTYDFQVFIYRKQNGIQDVNLNWGSNKVTATTLGSETTSTATEVTTKTSTSTATAPTTTTTGPTTTTTTQSTTTTISSPSSSSTAPPVTSSSTTPDMTTSTLSGSQDCQKQNDQQKTNVALGVIIALLVIVIIVGLLVHFVHRRRINQQSKTGVTTATERLSYGDDYENVAMSSSPDKLTAPDQARSAGGADMNVPSQNDTTISSINEADHSGKEQPYETLNNFEEVKGEYSRLNTRPTN